MYQRPVFSSALCCFSFYWCISRSCVAFTHCCCVGLIHHSCVALIHCLCVALIYRSCITLIHCAGVRLTPMCCTHSAIMRHTHSPFMFQPCSLESPWSSLFFDMYQVWDLPVLRYNQDEYASRCTYSPLSAHTAHFQFSSYNLNAHVHESIFLTANANCVVFSLSLVFFFECWLRLLLGLASSSPHPPSGYFVTQDVAIPASLLASNHLTAPIYNICKSLKGSIYPSWTAKVTSTKALSLWSPWADETG